MSDSHTITRPAQVTDDLSYERALRPQRLTDYVGQPFVGNQLALFIQAALLMKKPLDHVLLFGPPGLGKTTLALIVAREMGAELVQTSGPVLERPADVAALLSSLPPNAVLFIDEIHRLPAVVEEVLYAAMEDYRLDIRVGEGTQARTIHVALEPFTLVGATTRAGSLSAPLRDRFGITGRLEYYKPEDLANIVHRAAGLMGFTLSQDAAHAVAQRSRGTPRIANRLLRRVQDVAAVRHGVMHVTESVATEALDFLGVDALGLNEVDRRVLWAMHTNYGGGPVGLETLSAATGEAADTLDSVVEPYLMQKGLLERTPRGRVLTARALEVVSALEPVSE